jgi:hypothetical protein
MPDPALRPFWVFVRGDALRMFEAHEADATDSDLVLANTLPDRPARVVVGHFPLEMVEAWGEGAPPADMLYGKQTWIAGRLRRM